MSHRVFADEAERDTAWAEVCNRPTLQLQRIRSIAADAWIEPVDY